MKLNIKELQSLETQMLKEISEICERNDITYYLAYGSLLGAIRHSGPIPWDNDVDVALPDDQLVKFIKVVREELSEKLYLDYHDINKDYVMFFPRIGLKGYSTKVLHVDIYRIVGAPSDKKNQELMKIKASQLKNAIQYKNLKEGYFAFEKISLKAKLMVYLRTLQMQFVSKRKLINNFEKLCVQYPYNASETTLNITGGYGDMEFIPKKFYGNGIISSYSGFKVRIPELYDKYLFHFYGDFMVLPSLKKQRTKEFYFIRKL